MSNRHSVVYTDTHNGEANHAWEKRATVYMPEITHYGYDGGAWTYAKANKTYRRELMKAAKAAVGITGVRGRTFWSGDYAEFHPYGYNTILIIED